MEQTLVEWEDGWRVRLPLPFELRWIHTYILRDSEGYTVIDCGLNDDQAWETWQAVFDHLHIKPQDIRRIILTHYHPDHYGLAGRLQQYTGADVWMSALTEQYAERFWSRDGGHLEKIAESYRRYGLPAATAEDMKRNMQSLRDRVYPRPDVKIFNPGDTFSLGGRIYEVWHTPGHAEDHVSFYDPKREWLIGGDILLRKITPNISLYPGGDPNSLHTFFTTLATLEKKKIRKVFPAHGPVFDDVHVRIQELYQHHEERLQEIEQLVDGTRSAYDICLRLFGTELSIHNLRFAMAETLAHLEYLRKDDRLTLVDTGEIRIYEPA